MFELLQRCADNLAVFGMNNDAMRLDFILNILKEPPETITLEDVQNHDTLRELVLAADRITNAVEHEALSWCKTR